MTKNQKENYGNNKTKVIHKKETAKFQPKTLS